MLTVPSIPESISKVEAFLEKLSQDYSICPDRYPDILISLTEAVNNAIIHGNKKDGNKSVRIEMEQDKDNIILKVTDEGGGFDLQELPDPTSPDYIECCGGRGVFIMSHLSDKIAFQNNGSTVEMSFNV